MTTVKMDDQRDFVTRQYATLVGDGLDPGTARARLEDVLGKPALEYLDGRGAASTATDTMTTPLMDAAKALGGSPVDTHAAWLHSLGEAQLFALDWWRPVRTFLLYILFLLGLAVFIAIIYTVFVLPAFGHLDQTLAVRGGAADGVMAKGAIRLFAPLVVMAILFALLAMSCSRTRHRMATLAPLMGFSRKISMQGGSGSAYQSLICIECASALRAGGVAEEAVLDPALRLAQWPSGTPLKIGDHDLGTELDQARRLGTFGAELEWQRRLHWSRAQSQMELSRDRLILFSRVLFYVLIGALVTVLYLPIFSIANVFGVHG